MKLFYNEYNSIIFTIYNSFNLITFTLLNSVTLHLQMTLNLYGKIDNYKGSDIQRVNNLNSCTHHFWHAFDMSFICIIRKYVALVKYV